MIVECLTRRLAPHSARLDLRLACGLARCRLPELHAVELGGDAFGLLQGLGPVLHVEDGLQPGRDLLGLALRRLGEHVAFEVRDAPLVARPGQQLAQRVDQSGVAVVDRQAHAFQVHLDQGLVDALLAPLIPVDDLGVEERALQLRHPYGHITDLDHQAPLVMSGPVRAPRVRALVAFRLRQLVGLGIQHRVQQLLDVFGHEPSLQACKLGSH